MCICIASCSRIPSALSVRRRLKPLNTPSNGLISSEIAAFSATRYSPEFFLAPVIPYTEEAVHRDFQALWNTQFFEDIRLEVEDSPTDPGAKILVYYVTERPIIRRIEYKGNKSVTESDILDRFKERKVGLSVESQFDPTKIKRAEVVLKELLAEHGRQFATVKPTYERIASTNAVKLVFNIDEGPKVKVGEIKFDGNKAFSSRKTRARHEARSPLLDSAGLHGNSCDGQDLRPPETR